MTDSRRLSEAMEQRRIQLRMTWTKVATKADLSAAGLGAIRRGERNPSALTKAGIEHALQWEAGSVQAVLDGGDPTPAGESSVETGASSEELRQRIAELRDEIRYLDVKYERNRPLLVAHLERQIADLQKQLESLY